MEAFFDRSDSILKTIVYGSAFCRYLVSRQTSREALEERIEQVSDLTYRLRSVIGVIGIYLDWRSIPWSQLRSKDNERFKWKEAYQLGIVSSGIASNAMDFLAVVLWVVPRVRQFFDRLRAWLNFRRWLRPHPRAQLGASPSPLPVLDVTSDVSSSELSSSRLDDIRERVEWLSNVCWASMSTLSLIYSLYSLYRALRRMREARSAPVKEPLKVASGADEEEEEEPSVREAGIEALECALDLVGGASGVLKLQCEADGLTGIGPTLASCVHWAQMALAESEGADQEQEPESLGDSEDPLLESNVPEVDSPTISELVKCATIEEAPQQSRQEPSPPQDGAQLASKTERKRRASKRGKESKLSELPENKEALLKGRQDSFHDWQQEVLEKIRNDGFSEEL